MYVSFVIWCIFSSSLVQWLDPKGRRRDMIPLRQLLFLHRHVCSQLEEARLDESYRCLRHQSLVSWMSSLPETFALPRGAAACHAFKESHPNHHRTVSGIILITIFKTTSMVSITSYKNLVRKRSGWIIFQYKEITVWRGIKGRLSTINFRWLIWRIK